MSAAYYEDEAVTVVAADCLAALPDLEDASVDAVVTDPPYDLTSGKRGGTGMASVNLDSPYGRSRIGTGNGAGGFMGKAWDSTGIAFTVALWSECLRVLKPGGHMLAFGGTRTYHRMAVAVEDAGFEIRDTIAWLYGSGFPKSRNLDGDWQGWGTALKPANEPIIVARKSPVGTVAANVEAHGVGALNIDATRVPFQSDADRRANDVAEPGLRDSRSGFGGGLRTSLQECGRWPSNVCLDENTAAELDGQSGVLTSGANPSRRGSDKFRTAYGDFPGQADCEPARGADSGGASRFFPTFRYEPKAPADERPNVDGVMHPTVKPLDLIRWLTRLVTPPNGLVLDPFLGSGTTAEACVIEGFRCIGIEREPDYLPLILARLSKPIQPDIFGGAA